MSDFCPRCQREGPTPKGIIPLAHGDNGLQEFWESFGPGDHDVLIFRNRGEGLWTVAVDGLVVKDEKLTRQRYPHGGGEITLGGATPESAARQLREQKHIRVTFSRSHEWVRAPKGARTFRIIPLFGTHRGVSENQAFLSGGRT